jgi:hypothetical protein
MSIYSNGSAEEEAGSVEIRVGIPFIVIFVEPNSMATALLDPRSLWQVGGSLVRTPNFDLCAITARCEVFKKLLLRLSVFAQPHSDKKRRLSAEPSLRLADAVEAPIVDGIKLFVEVEGIQHKELLLERLQST